LIIFYFNEITDHLQILKEFERATYPIKYIINIFVEFGREILYQYLTAIQVIK